MAIKKVLCSLFFLVLLAQFSSQTILITQPAVTSFVKNEVQYWYSNFGIIHYNKPMSYEIYVSNSTLCGDEEEAKILHFKRPTYMIVNENGGCSFPKKALKAQELGAQGIMFGSH